LVIHNMHHSVLSVMIQRYCLMPTSFDDPETPFKADSEESMKETI
jgi:hypothetical protein